MFRRPVSIVWGVRLVISIPHFLLLEWSAPFLYVALPVWAWGVVVGLLSVRSVIWVLRRVSR